MVAARPTPPDDGRQAAGAAPPSRGDGPRAREAGFALLAVLWILVLVGALSAQFLGDAQAQRRSALNARDAAGVRWAARAALARSLARLDATLREGRPTRSLEVESARPLLRMESNGVAARVWLRDARSRLHLNEATPRRLRRLVRALFPSATAEGITSAILDWRDADSRRRPGGAEAETYAALGIPGAPRDGPFTSVEEVRRLAGVTTEIHARLAPHLTVRGDGRINLNAAPPAVLRTVPGIDPTAAREIIRRRDSAPFGSPFEVLSVLPAEERQALRARLDLFVERVAFGPRRIELVVEAAAGRGAPASSITAVVELQGGREWRVVSLVER